MAVVGSNDFACFSEILLTILDNICGSQFGLEHARPV